MGSVSPSIFTSLSESSIYISIHNELCWNAYRS
ncbi:hypothetical protein Goshw_027834 [Gossypium schwendimanii]|uniref:Uncharacterized protein n=1 Tax=Gossypium schwendimanii TaxID=34291 RepID=A0A7J9MVR4_GOSSC|nr:hypothetical protein [Gossypium schwendimanii]